MMKLSFGKKRLHALIAVLFTVKTSCSTFDWGLLLCFIENKPKVILKIQVTAGKRFYLFTFLHSWNSFKHSKDFLTSFAKFLEIVFYKNQLLNLVVWTKDEFNKDECRLLNNSMACGSMKIFPPYFKRTFIVSSFYYSSFYRWLWFVGTLLWENYRSSPGVIL